MKNAILNTLVITGIISISSCSDSQKSTSTLNEPLKVENETPTKSEQHQYGGWYCPDNLYGFPAVDIAEWKSVPVVNNRMATETETKNGTSLIFVDTKKYPNAKPLDMTMPRLARFYNRNANRDDIVIVIQAINVDNDSIVGFRYLNGGNGSSRLSEVTFLSDEEIKSYPSTRFVSQSIEINAKPDAIWEVLTKPEHFETLKTTFDKTAKNKADDRPKANVNFRYSIAGKITGAYGGELFGNYYIQNDFEKLDYTEKFMLVENKETGITTLKIVCGPFATDYETQKAVLNNWGQKVKTLSEK